MEPKIADKILVAARVQVGEPATDLGKIYNSEPASRGGAPSGGGDSGLRDCWRRSISGRKASPLASTYGASIENSAQTGTWSEGFSQLRTRLSMPTTVKRSAAWGDSTRWSMRIPLFFCHAPAW